MAANDLPDSYASYTLKAADLSDDSPASRTQFVKLARQVVGKLDEPCNIAVDLIMAPFANVAARIAVDLNLFRLISEHVGPITCAELAKRSGGEKLLIVRVLRPLTPLGVVREIAPNTWEANATTRVMASDAISAGFRMVGETILMAAVKAPKYFREAGYRCPSDPHDGITQYAFQTKLAYFPYLHTMPALRRDFDTYMGSAMGARVTWVDWFPIRDLILNDGYKPSSAAKSDKLDPPPLLVDVGGGKGHDLAEFHAKHPTPGRIVILQDLPDVLAPVLINPGFLGDPDVIRFMAHDFFTPQPIAGARAYLYHHILHGWSDDRCLAMLAALRPAMMPRYSRLLVHDQIVPERGASWFTGLMDLATMAMNGGMERTGAHWRALLEKAGFRVMGIWDGPQEGGDGMVMAEVDEKWQG